MPPKEAGAAGNQDAFAQLCSPFRFLMPPLRLRQRRNGEQERQRRIVMAAKVAETEGFEPSVREYPVRRFSKPLVSATHPRLRVRPFAGSGGYIRRIPKL